MAKFEITALDITNAEEYLTELLQEKFPDIDVGKGSALRDLLITPFSFMYATLRKQMESLRMQQSLLTLSQLESTEETDAVIDRILSNWLLSRNSGNYARGQITIYLSRRTDVLIPAQTQFVRDSGLIFYPDIADDIYVVTANTLNQIIDANGRVTGYYFTLPVVASATGSRYNVEPGDFKSWSAFSNAVVRVRNHTAFTGGRDIESTAELLSRAPTAVTIRDFNSKRAIDSLLRNNFSAIERIVVKGFGDPELQRDYHETLRIHLGGFADIFVKTPVVFNQIYEGIIGAEVNDPRPGYYVLQDDTISDFTAQVATPYADNLVRIYNAEHNEATLYKVSDVVPSGIRIHREHFFPRELPTVIRDIVLTLTEPNFATAAAYVFTAADVGRYIQIRTAANVSNIGIRKILSVDTDTNTITLDAPNVTTESDVNAHLCTRVVDYSVGTNYPTYDNKIPRRVSGMFTKKFGTMGRLVLPFHPVYYIKEIVIPGSAYPSWQDADNKIHFTTRVNRTPTARGEFQVICNNPEESNSGWQINEVVLAVPNVPGFSWDGQLATVTYDTLQDFNNIWNYVTDDFRRVVCANIIPRGMFAVYLSFEVNYVLKPTGDIINETEAINKLVNFINTFPGDGVLDVSDINAYLRQEYSSIDYIEPLRIFYWLYAPDGRVIPYATTGRVSVDATLQIGTVSEDKLSDLLSAGISDSLLFYVTRNDLITLVRQ